MVHTPPPKKEKETLGESRLPWSSTSAPTTSPCDLALPESLSVRNLGNHIHPPLTALPGWQGNAFSFKWQ